MGHFAAALLLAFAVAQADRCESPQTQAEMNVCSAQQFHRADAQLNAVYQKVLKAVGPSRVSKLRTSQRAWLAFRDAQCDFEASESEGGTMHPMLVTGCMTEVTNARIGQLRGELTEGR